MKQASFSNFNGSFHEGRFYSQKTIPEVWSDGGPTQRENGDSAYQVAVNNGFVGTEQEWLASLIGEQGIQGIQGLAGATGTTGVQGEPGIQGGYRVVRVLQAYKVRRVKKETKVIRVILAIVSLRK